MKLQEVSEDTLLHTLPTISMNTWLKFQALGKHPPLQRSQQFKDNKVTTTKIYECLGRRKNRDTVFQTSFTCHVQKITYFKEDEQKG